MNGHTQQQETGLWHKNRTQPAAEWPAKASQAFSFISGEIKTSTDYPAHALERLANCFKGRQQLRESSSTRHSHRESLQHTPSVIAPTHLPRLDS
jgi:hypothetical protein